MAVTISTRAGSALKAHVYYWVPGKAELMPSDGYTARLQLRSLSGAGRVLMSTHAVLSPPSAPLVRVEESHWRINFGGSVTKTFPPVVQFEMELVNDLDPEDVVPLMSGTINTTPQGVSNA